MTTSSRIARPLQALGYARNGRYPDAEFQSLLQKHTNFAARHRSKEVFAWSTPNGIIAAGSTSTTRWRWAWHSSPRAWGFVAYLFLNPRSGVTTPTPEVTITIRNAAGVVLGTASHVENVQLTNTGALAVVMDPTTGGSLHAPDQDLYATLVQSGGMVVQSISFVEVGWDPELPENVGAFSAMYRQHREDAADELRALWKHHAAPLISWTVEADANKVTIGSTLKNLADPTVTTITDHTPGWSFDLSSCRRQRTFLLGVTPTVPCKLTAYVGAFNTGGVVGDEANILVWSPTLTSVGTLVIPYGSVAGWYSTTIYMPATSGKYDLVSFVDGAGTIDIYAANVFQYET